MFVASSDGEVLNCQIDSEWREFERREFLVASTLCVDSRLCRVHFGVPLVNTVFLIFCSQIVVHAQLAIL